MVERIKVLMMMIMGILYAQGYWDDVIYYNFDDLNIPSGWVVIDGNEDGVKWRVGWTNFIGTPPPYHDGNYNGSAYVYYCDRCAGNGVVNYNEGLITKGFYSYPNDLDYVVIYSYSFNSASVKERFRVFFRIAVWVDTSIQWGDWILLKSYPAIVGHLYGVDTFSFANYLPFYYLQLKFVYDDSATVFHYGYACAIDNFKVRRYVDPSGIIEIDLKRNIKGLYYDVYDLSGRKLQNDLMSLNVKNLMLRKGLYFVVSKPSNRVYKFLKVK